MSDEEIDRLAEKLAGKLQTAVISSVYQDAGRNLIDLIKKSIWATVIAIAAWGAAKYGSHQ